MINSKDWKWAASNRDPVRDEECIFSLLTQVGNWMVHTVRTLQISNYETSVYRVYQGDKAGTYQSGVPFFERYSNDGDFKRTYSEKDAREAHYEMCLLYSSAAKQEKGNTEIEAFECIMKILGRGWDAVREEEKIELVKKLCERYDIKLAEEEE